MEKVFLRIAGNAESPLRGKGGFCLPDTLSLTPQYQPGILDKIVQI